MQGVSPRTRPESSQHRSNETFDSQQDIPLRTGTSAPLQFSPSRNFSPQDWPSSPSQPRPLPAAGPAPYQPSPFTFSPSLSPYERAVIPARRHDPRRPHSRYAPSLRSSQVPPQRPRPLHVSAPSRMPSMDSNGHHMTHQPHPYYHLPRPEPQTYNGPSVTPSGLPPILPLPTTEPFGWQLPPQLPSSLPGIDALHVPRSQSPPAPKRQRNCLVCMDDLDEDMFPYKCKKCPGFWFCKDCLKGWFLDACKNESKMVPKCCSAIPISAVASLLTPDEIELFKAKFEEWSTPNRLYCPVPTCSTFISPRLYVKPTMTTRLTENHVSCPKCGTSVCTQCRTRAHIDDCPKSDIDPALEEQLKKWKIKRCPKCKTGVRKMFGCAHVECHCGAHFCWECLQPIGVCDGSCDDSENENDAEVSEPDEDDLDGRAGYGEDDNVDFGPEPYGTVADSWGCNHIWLTVRSRPDNDEMECHQCFRRIHPLAPESPVEKDHDGDIMMSGMSWQCAGAHMVCPRCPRPNSVLKDKSAPNYTCWCGTVYCPICDGTEKIRELETAHECRCGMLICGACKNEVDS